MSIEITEDFLAKAGGWEVLKQARSAVASGKVLSSDWTPPVLKGVIQEGPTAYRAGLVIKSTVDIENLCSCRSSRSWGAICAHSVAIALHYIRSKNPLPAPPLHSPVSGKAPAATAASVKAKPVRQLQRIPEGGVEAEVYVIFPPNLEQAIERGKVMLCFEGKRSGARMPLGSLPQQIIYTFGAEDLPLLDKAESLAGGDTPTMLMLSTDALAELLPTMSGHPRLAIGRGTAVTVTDTSAPIQIKATLESNGEIRIETKRTDADGILFGKSARWIYQGGRFQPAALPVGIDFGVQRIPREQVPLFLSTAWPALQRHAQLQANFKLDDFQLEPSQPEFVLNLKGGIAHLQAQLIANYQGRTFDLSSKAAVGLWLPDPQRPTRYSTRNPAAEDAARNRLMRSGFTGPHEDGSFQLAGQNQVLSFFARDYPRLQREWKVDLEERLQKSTEKNLERIDPKFAIRPTGENWFDLDVSFTSAGGQKFSAADIQRLILSGQNHTRLPNGKFALIDTGAVEELQEVILDCAPEQMEGKYRIRNTQASFLNSALHDQPGWQVQASSEWRARAARQSGEVQLAAPPLGALESVLRPYQKEGVAWLHFLRQNKFGGILADEMGLGKTLQTLAFLQNVLKNAGANKRPCLIVCPTSLVYNWMAEAERFTPDLKCLALQGPARHRLFESIPSAELVVTSYALIRRDTENYREFEFDTIVLDEAQHIKNRQSQNAQAVKTIRTSNRLVLTGTPLENSVLDLWSIFDFLMPGYLGTANDFKERYEAPIVRDKSKEAQARLTRRVRPFLLRRLKQEVAKDLPARIEQISFCELTEEQQSVYQQLLDASRQEVVNAVEGQGLQKSRMVVLNALLRLRQVCCDLRLLDLKDLPRGKTSGKVDLFGELLEEVIDGGHRVLVFSQFVKMLKILEARLKEEDIAYCYLDGSTTDRGAVVQQFQKDSAIPVFLISLKAGGVGLNLTGADTVVHFDPWWNPAVEDQATDRAHRIGQSRVVTSYKLITRGTVEEKILQLQNRKRAMTKATLEGEEQFTETLTWEEIQGLLQ